MESGAFGNQALLIANKGSDHQPDHFRVQDFENMLRSKDLNIHLLPLGADLSLSLREAQEFRHLVAEHFSLLVAMGGEDIHPHRYGERITDAVKMNSYRDRAEMDLIRTYTEVSKGFLLGVCRGGQITAAALSMRFN